VYTSNDPVASLSEFKPNFYDLLLVDINMPHMNGFELSEKILAIDVNVRICFMSAILSSKATIVWDSLYSCHDLLSGIT
jgi:two-component SAPR family response regulator